MFSQCEITQIIKNSIVSVLEITYYFMKSYYSYYFIAHSSCFPALFRTHYFIYMEVKSRQTTSMKLH